MKTVQTAPKAALLIESMRDIGYSLETALADVIDNGITAKATRIDILTDLDPSQLRIGILDNGSGMTEHDLLEAMRPGSRNPRDVRNPMDLGRFGLGLKTASFSQCRCVTVITRINGITSAAIWDLDFVADENDWLVQIPNDFSSIPWVDMLPETGTLVIWDRLDRVVEQNGADTGIERFVKRLDEAREHLELVFHRFLSGEQGLKRIEIRLNDRPLVPFDPFHSSHPATTTEPLTPEIIKVGDHEVSIQTFTLPHHKKVTPQEWERYAGRAGYQKNQGFYVYRQKRLIIHGTWFGLARQTELTKLARVRIDMPNGLDADWKIDVKKASAQPPRQVRERLRRIIETIGATSKRVYTARGRVLVTDSRLPVWNRVQDKNEISYQINPSHPVVAEFVDQLSGEQRRAFGRIIELLGSSLPMDALFADLGGEPDKVSGNALSDEALHHVVTTTITKLLESGVRADDIIAMLKVTEPFRSNWERAEILSNNFIAGGDLSAGKSEKSGNRASSAFRSPSPTPEKIRELIKSFRVIPSCSVGDEEAEHLARMLEARHDVTMTIGSVLTDHEFEPWLDGRRSAINPYYWNRYRQYLAGKKYAAPVIATMEEVTDRILGLLENPEKEGSWDRRGMVVGHVQSGKTANYTGLICKAADAGYRLIIVIAGIHNNLRNQTQTRIDEGFVGRDSALKVTDRERRIIGVGNYDSTRQPWTFTNSKRDFNRAGAEQVGGKLADLNVPAVFVIKKNSSTLKNLTEWLKEYNARRGGKTVDAPMLLIDDEADNASINIKHGSGEVSKINGQIRDLLDMFERSCYVGYTATPFANIFISPDTDENMLHGEDLFPRNFIVGLDPPDNYFGAARVFLEDSNAVICHIDDNEDYLPLKHEKETQVTALPPSMVEAVRTFVIARAIRLVRGQVNEHNSMLVNASRFTDVQRQLRNEIHTLLDGIQASCRVNGALPSKAAMKDPEITALHDVWEKEYADAGPEWPAVLAQLHEAASPIRVVEVNSRSSGTLNYQDHEKTGLNVIAVGGFSLSRGLTLEGLMVSYFLRNSMMYDTLMQMGRWFGYRPGYDDLCRVWMPQEAESWYRHIAISIDELREEMRRMEEANATPEQFGLKVRSHPDTLIVTARNKMGSGEQVVWRVGLSNEFIETTALKRDAADANRKAATNFAERLAAAGMPTDKSEIVSGGRLLKDVPIAPVLEFLTEFQNDPLSMLTDPLPVRRYIEARPLEMAKWDVLFASTTRSDPLSLVDNSLGIEIVCQRRKEGTGQKNRRTATLLITDNQRVASRGVEKTGVDPEAAKAAEAEYRAEKKIGDSETPNYPDRIYRNRRTRPLLVIHLLAIGEKGDDLSQQKPVVAWSISFPKTSLEEERVEYVVNTTWLRENYRDDIEEDEMAGDDE